MSDLSVENETNLDTDVASQIIGIKEINERKFSASQSEIGELKDLFAYNVTEV